MPKPTAEQRRTLNGYDPNSLLGKLPAAERKRIQALMKKDREDRLAYERGLSNGSSPRRWT